MSFLVSRPNKLFLSFSIVMRRSFYVHHCARASPTTHISKKCGIVLWPRCVLDFVLLKTFVGRPEFL